MSSLYVGQVFENINGFKEALRNWAIANHFEFSVKSINAGSPGKSPSEVAFNALRAKL
jgi:hypothetical protein